MWLQAQGAVLARRGDLGGGERLACEAVALAAETDMLNTHADALVGLMAERTRSRLAELTAA